jgi:hypothetical protein
MTVGAIAQAPLSEESVKEAIALGKSCGNVPLVKISKPGGDFDVYIEGPFARIAVRAAAARQMHQPFEVSNITAYRFIAEYKRTVVERDAALDNMGEDSA